MMEHRENKYGHIQTDFICRIKNIICQYEQYVDKLKPEERYESTLVICALQSVVSFGTELFKVENSSIKNKTISNDTKFSFILNKIERNSFDTDVTIRDLIFHLRHSLSHPTQFENYKDGYKTTGYTSIANNDGIIQEYVFVHSPDIKNKSLVKNFNAKNKIFVMTLNTKEVRKLVFELIESIAEDINDRNELLRGK